MTYRIEDRVLPAVAAGRVAPLVALWWAVQLCEALVYAHANGVVHRDIKPENILITPDGRAKLVGFGLAKLLHPGVEAVRLTASNQVMGTLRYMAPEQIDRPRNVDHRADIYSLGVVLYYTIPVIVSDSPSPCMGEAFLTPSPFVGEGEKSGQH